jgi:methionine synthase II (cobalamin-independent)
VAVEFGILVGGFEATATQDFDSIIRRLVEAVEQVPVDVPVGLHLCYGDYEHAHFREPESLELQVRVANRVVADASRSIDWFAFTVPQEQSAPAYFAPLADLRVDDATELAFALVPYHPERQAAGVTEAQIEHLDERLGERAWGICTECGMGRVDRDQILDLLDVHRAIVRGARVPA